MGSELRMMSALPSGMTSAKMGSELMRRWLKTEPPRWDMPWISLCLTFMPRLRAASLMILATETIPSPPTPQSMMSFFIVSVVFCG